MLDLLAQAAGTSAPGDLLGLAGGGVVGGGLLGGTLYWLTRSLIPRLMEQFDKAELRFETEIKAGRAEFLAALKELRQEDAEERRQDREIRHQTANELTKLALAVGLLGENPPKHG